MLGFRKKGYKTEAAFCEIFGITGDPYRSLIHDGIEEGIYRT